MLRVDTSYLTTPLLAATSKCSKGSVLVSACQCLRETFSSSDLYQKVVLPAKRRFKDCTLPASQRQKGSPGTQTADNKYLVLIRNKCNIQ